MAIKGYTDKLFPLEKIAKDQRFVRVQDKDSGRITYEWEMGGRIHVFNVLTKPDGKYCEYAGSKVSLNTRVEFE